MGVALAHVGWDDEHAAQLRTAQQAELRERYGDDDIGHEMTGESIVAMVVLREDDEPVACVALRDASDELGAGVAEVKRLYTVPGARGRGHSRRVMLELERLAHEQGWTRLVLETGVLQPEAIGLYLSLGYRSIPNYAEYVDEPSSRCFAKDLTASAARERPGAHDRRPLAVEGGRSLVIETVGWDDDTAVALRRAMWAWNTRTYPELVTDEPDHGFASDDARQRTGELVTWVARLDDEPVGCLTLRTPRDGYPDGSVELKKLYVTDQARGAGVARSLLATAHDEARARGFTTAVLGTGIRQPEAITLYLSDGYRPIRPFTNPARDFITLWFARPLH